MARYKTESPDNTNTKLIAERLTRQQALDVSRAFGQHLRAGLEGNPSSLQCAQTYLHPIDKKQLTIGDEVLVVEYGGTHIRSSIVRLGHEKNPQIISEALSRESKKKYDSVEEFTDEMIGDVRALSLYSHPKAIAAIWSFPPKNTFYSPHGIDMYSTNKLTKELVIPGIEEIPVGDFTIRAVQKAGVQISSDFPRVVLNDTVAILIANNATFGGIIATGINFAFLHGGQIYNLEAGGFTEVPQNALSRAVDTSSARPGNFPLEKQVSGDYVGRAFTLSLQELDIADRAYTSADMSAVLSGELFTDNQAVRDAAAALKDRSAQLVGAVIAGAIREFPEDFPGDEITIPIDGSFFGKTPGYKEAVEFYASDLLDNKKKVVTMYVQESGMKGAALAALGEVK